MDKLAVLHKGLHSCHGFLRGCVAHFQRHIGKQYNFFPYGQVEIDAENQFFTTKGDANKSEDAAPVHFNNLIGVPVFAVPLLGYVSAYIQSPPGMYVAIGLGAALLAAVFLPDLLTKKEKKEEKQEEAK